jgi:hypothetical protein
MRRNVAGWAAVAINTAVASIWAFWGAIEAFHEGWWHETLGGNLIWTIAYLGPVLIWTGLGLGALRFPRAGSALYIAAGLLLGGWILSLLHENATLTGRLLAILMAGFCGATGLLWWIGRPRPRWAEETDADSAWRVVYNGLVIAVPKRLGMGSQAFRAVREPDGER